MPRTIQDILQSVRKDQWRGKLKKIKDGMDAYEKGRTGQSSLTIDEILENNLNPILPTYWEVFHTHNIDRIRNGKLPRRGDNNEILPYYDVGIFLVGYRSLPIVLSLAEIQPCEKIYFLYSQDTRNILYEIGNRLVTMLNGSNSSFVDLVETTVLSNLDEPTLAIDDPSDPVATFKRIKEIINNIDETDNKHIALDLTGGKKTMIGGGFTAGAIWASRWSEAAQELLPFCDMFYIDSLKYDPNRGSPEPGTEFLSLLENPYDVYNVQTVQSAEELFRQHNYEASVNLWDGVVEKLDHHATRYGLEAEKEETNKRRRMANCYYLWDAFYYDKAKRSKNRHGQSWAYEDKHVRDEIDVLNILSTVYSHQTLFEAEARIIHYAVDRYQNGIRRKESGKLDDAMVRFTQVIEMLCNYKIYQIAQEGLLLNEDDNQVNNPPNKLDITPLILFLFGSSNRYYRSPGSYYKISDCNRLLNRADYDCNDVNEITDLIKSRNDFIHFNNRMNQTQTEENAAKLQKLALRFLANFSKDYRGDQCLSFKNLLKLHRFRR